MMMLLLLLLLLLRLSLLLLLLLLLLNGAMQFLWWSDAPLLQCLPLPANFILQLNPSHSATPPPPTQST